MTSPAARLPWTARAVDVGLSALAAAVLGADRAAAPGVRRGCGSTARCACAATAGCSSSSGSTCPLPAWAVSPASSACTRARVAIGVGGLFDFYAGRVSRAPGWLRELGLEWVYRFSQEPGRMWRRYWIGNFVFVARVLRERLRGRQTRLPRKPWERKP